MIAQYNLSQCYILGEGINQDEKKAFELIKNLAEEEEYLNAQFQPGYYYDKRFGTKIDKSKAFELFKIAAKSGYIVAKYNLSILYQPGKGIDKDEKKAIELIKKLVKKEEYLSAQCQ